MTKASKTNRAGVLHHSMGRDRVIIRCVLPFEDVGCVIGYVLSFEGMCYLFQEHAMNCTHSLPRSFASNNLYKSERQER